MTVTNDVHVCNFGALASEFRTTVWAYKLALELRGILLVLDGIGFGVGMEFLIDLLGLL